VLRYGNARELCLGLEVVTPQGEIWSGLTGLRKNNTGYDLRDLFIGAEGTLGIITAACMKLFPLPASNGTALAALQSVDDALKLLELAQRMAGPTLTGFELFNDLCLQLVEKHFADHNTPFTQRHAHYVLIEISNHEQAGHTQALLERLLQTAIEVNLVQDAVVAQSGKQAAQLWELREHISEAQAAEGSNIKHDISVPISCIGEFVRETDALLQRQFPGVRMVSFGHLGDGNLHYNVSEPQVQTAMHNKPVRAEPVEAPSPFMKLATKKGDPSTSSEPAPAKAWGRTGFDSDSQMPHRSNSAASGAFLLQQPYVYCLVHDQVHKFGGSISAEHGIGQLKREELLRYKSATEMRLMHAIKNALDPLGIMNPGKVI
jgi:FAD/FMN-containing dehydrogenase